MSFVIDQSWVPEWVSGKLSLGQEATMRLWLAKMGQSLFPVLRRLPPMCVVRARRSMEVPYIFTVGFVYCYYPDGGVGVRQEPYAPEAKVSPDDLELVAYWKSFDSSQVSSILWTTPPP